MTRIVRMQAVVVFILEIGRHLVHQRIESTERVQINHRHRPEVARLLHRLHVGIDILPAEVRIILTRLPVLVVGIKLRTVYGRHQHNLLRGIQPLHIVQRLVDTSPIR